MPPEVANFTGPPKKFNDGTLQYGDVYQAPVKVGWIKDTTDPSSPIVQGPVYWKFGASGRPEIWDTNISMWRVGSDTTTTTGAFVDVGAGKYKQLLNYVNPSVSAVTTQMAVDFTQYQQQSNGAAGAPALGSTDESNATLPAADRNGLDIVDSSAPESGGGVVVGSGSSTPAAPKIDPIKAQQEAFLKDHLNAEQIALVHNDIGGALINEIADVKTVDDGKGVYVLTTPGYVYSAGTAQYAGSPQEDAANGSDYWARDSNRQARSLTVNHNGSYTVVSNNGENYDFGADAAAIQAVREEMGPNASIIGDVVDVKVIDNGAGTYVLTKDGYVYASGTAKYAGSPQEDLQAGNDYWTNGERQAARLEIDPAGGYTVISSNDEAYNYGGAAAAASGSGDAPVPQASAQDTALSNAGLSSNEIKLVNDALGSGSLVGNVVDVKKVDGGNGVYVLTDQGFVYAAGTAKYAGGPQEDLLNGTDPGHDYWTNGERSAKRLEVSSNGSYTVVSNNGEAYNYGGATMTTEDVKGVSQHDVMAQAVDATARLIDSSAPVASVDLSSTGLNEQQISLLESKLDSNALQTVKNELTMGGAMGGQYFVDAKSVDGGKGVYILDKSAGVIPVGTAQYASDPNVDMHVKNDPYWVNGNPDRTAARLEVSGNGNYTVVSTDNETYNYGDAAVTNESLNDSPSPAVQTAAPQAAALSQQDAFLASHLDAGQVQMVKNALGNSTLLGDVVDVKTVDGGAGVYVLTKPGFIYAAGTAQYAGGPQEDMNNGDNYWVNGDANRSAQRLEVQSNGKYTIFSNHGESYNYGSAASVPEPQNDPAPAATLPPAPEPQQPQPAPGVSDQLRRTIEKDYYEVLGRAPEEDEVRYWGELISSGVANESKMYAELQGQAPQPQQPQAPPADNTSFTPQAAAPAPMGIADGFEQREQATLQAGGAWFQGNVVKRMAAPGGGYWAFTDQGAVYAFEGAPYLGAANGQAYWSDGANRTVANVKGRADGGYTLISNNGEFYDYAGGGMPASGDSSSAAVPPGIAAFTTNL